MVFKKEVIKMILLRRSKLDEWLLCIGRNQSWLAKVLGVSKGYVSLLASNKCQVPKLILERLLLLSHMEFRTLFYMDGQKDGRQFFGGETWTLEKNTLQSNIDYKGYVEKLSGPLSQPKEI
jgi:hypothetical protein